MRRVFAELSSTLRLYARLRRVGSIRTYGSIAGCRTQLGNPTISQNSAIYHYIHPSQHIAQSCTIGTVATYRDISRNIAGNFWCRCAIEEYRGISRNIADHRGTQPRRHPVPTSRHTEGRVDRATVDARAIEIATSHFIAPRMIASRRRVAIRTVALGIARSQESAI